MNQRQKEVLDEYLRTHPRFTIEELEQFAQESELFTEEDNERFIRDGRRKQLQKLQIPHSEE